MSMMKLLLYAKLCLGGNLQNLCVYLLPEKIFASRHSRMFVAMLFPLPL